MLTVATPSRVWFAIDSEPERERDMQAAAVVSATVIVTSAGRSSDQAVVSASNCVPAIVLPQIRDPA
jgi:hypothetical protein